MENQSFYCSAETNTINQYSNIREYRYYSIRIRIFVDVIDNVLSIYDSLYYEVGVCVDCLNMSVRS